MTKHHRLLVKPGYGSVMVKVGFSWPAFFFGSLWAIVKRMWYPCLPVMLGLDFVVWFLSGYAEAQKNGALAFFVMAGIVLYAIVRGRFGNRWLLSSLSRKGYAERDPSIRITSNHG